MSDSNNSSNISIQDVTKLLRAQAIPWLVIDRQGEITGAELSIDNKKLVEEAALARVAEGARGGAELIVEGITLPVEILESADGECLVYFSAALEDIELQLSTARAVARLAGPLVHHYNNILTEFYGHVSLLTRMFPDQDLNERLEKIVDTVNRTRQLFERYMFMLREVRQTEQTVNLGQVLVDLRTVLEPMLNPRIALEFTPSTGTPVQIGLSHQKLLQILVATLVAIVNEALVAHRIELDAEVVGDRLALGINHDGAAENWTNAQASVLAWVGHVLRADGGRVEFEDANRLVLMLPGALDNDTAADSVSTGGSGARKASKSIILLIDPESERSDTNKGLLEALGFSVLDISEGTVANEVFLAQPGIFEFVFVEARFESVAKEMAVMSPDAVRVFNDVEWPVDEQSWTACLDSLSTPP